MIELIAVTGIITVGAAFANTSRSGMGKVVAVVITACLLILMII